MQRFIVPQFIDVKPKILGPLTVHQFVLVLIGGIIVFLAFRFGDIPFFIFVSLITGGFVFLFAFFKVNGAPFHEFLLNIIIGLKRPSLRVWHREISQDELMALFSQTKGKHPSAMQLSQKKQRISPSRLAELSLIVDTHGRCKGEDDKTF